MRIPHNERVSSDIAEDGPERSCILSGVAEPRDALIRLAISPDGLVLPDALARAPGRGAWVGVTRCGLNIPQRHPGVEGVPAQQVEVVRRLAGQGDAHRALGAQLQEPLDAARGVVGTLPLMAVGE